MNKIDLIAKEISDLYKDVSSKRWVQYTTGFDLGITDAENRVKDYKKNPEMYKLVLNALASQVSPLEKRKAEILNKSIKDYHLSDKVKKMKDEIDVLENSLMDILNKFRAQIDGKEVSSTEREKILSQSADRNLRQKAYESNLPLNQILVDHGFLKLVNLRKELAAESGADNFVDYVLDQEDLNLDLFRDWASICEQRSSKYQSKSNELAERYLKVDCLMPWDQKYVKNQICSLNKTQVDMTNFQDLMTKTFSKFDFDLSKLNLTYDIFPRKNKSEWGYHFMIEMGKDSRILANVSNRFSDYWVLLHETAHGAHYMGLNPEENILNWGVSGILSEGFANFFGNQCYSKEFLSEVFRDNYEDAFHEFKKLDSFTHYQNYQIVPDILFDQQLYLKDLNSANDLQELRQSIGKQVLGEGGYTVPWARLIHHTSHPIYLHNYFLGDVMSENMKKEFSKRFPRKKAEENPDQFGRFWKSELLNPSGKDPFLKLYKNVFNTDLSITDYIDSKCLA